MTQAVLEQNLLQLGNDRLAQLKQVHPRLQPRPQAEQILAQLLSLSDFIFQSCSRFESIAQYFLQLQDEQQLLQPIDTDIEQSYHLDEVSFSRALRVYRQWIMSVIAARDLLGLQSITVTMTQLSALADQFYLWARTWAKAQLAPRWGIALAQDGSELELIALGMGKLGGEELNFSSDIDLIFCYGEKGQTQTGRRQEDFQIYFTKLAQKIIQLLDNVSAEGRVFRVDMRLRPFGDSGPLVSNFDALEDYYQDQGRDWERYALLKARPLGGQSISASEQAQQALLMQTLKPFVYRRYIDFSVIDSLRSMKTMIRQEVKRRNLTLNIKLGEGGIREAEFIVQALQMLRGGKAAELQKQSLLQSIPVLTQLNVFSQDEARALTDSYLWLRQCEQYLQAFADQQTQTLPEDEVNQSRLCQLFGYANWPQFIQQYQRVCATIHQLFIDVIGEPEQDHNGSCDQMQIWTELWLCQYQEQLSEQVPADLVALVNDKKSELCKAVSGARGQEKLDKLMPHLLYELAVQQVSKDQASSLLALIKTIASRTTYLELLLENPGARTQLVKLTNSCQFIGQQLSKFPLLLDLLIDPKLLYSPVAVDSYDSELRRQLLRVEPDDLELQMEVLRQFKLSSQLAIAACDVEGVLNLMQVSDHLTALAEACLQHAVNIAWSQMTARYGLPVGASEDNKNFGVLGYGKLGGYELGYGSDLDIVFVHNCQSSQATNGHKQIDSRQFYIKLAQRIMHIFTTRTFSGELYEVDTRLRPSGASGLLAINIETFADYQMQEAWTWEHQALVRCRFVLGDEPLRQRFEQIRQQILAQPREQDKLQQDVSSMRQKMFDNLAKEQDGMFDLKQSRGGIADIEFISQYLVLSQAERSPSLLANPDNVRIVEQAVLEQLISASEAKSLLDAYVDYRARYHLAALNNQAKQVPQQQVQQQASAVVAVWQQLGLS